MFLGTYLVHHPGGFTQFLQIFFPFFFRNNVYPAEVYKGLDYSVNSTVQGIDMFLVFNQFTYPGSYHVNGGSSQVILVLDQFFTGDMDCEKGFCPFDRKIVLMWLEFCGIQVSNG